jgi:2'-5' RNA ligase
MRLFVAIEIDPDTRAQLAATRAALESALSSSAVPPRVTWVRSEAAHITLCFLGEIEESRVAAIQEALGYVTLEPFDLAWGTLGVFGGWRHPRVIWMAPTNTPLQLTTVALQVQDRVEQRPAGDPARPFKAHLTLGRIRHPGRGVNWNRAVSSIAIPHTVTRVDHVTLYQSRLSPKGPTYTAWLPGCEPGQRY